jgi:hypothetical protein|tara:strand:+ start:1192 stop:1341 length:150 start_codon:yes stop_codon:yes gene_type:complete
MELEKITMELEKIFQGILKFLKQFNPLIYILFVAWAILTFLMGVLIFND